MKKVLKITLLIIIILLCIIGIYLIYLFNIIPLKGYTAERFGIETIKSSVDYDNDAIDDYTDILLGARQDAINHPTYDGRYWTEGYPPDDIGVCTDVVWRAFRDAGYNLREMLDQDVGMYPEDYPYIEKKDKNIDFRRVGNLHFFFKKYGITLTNDINDTSEWQPGDIVIFGAEEHIGIVSDKRNRKGQTYIIHNGGQPNREEDFFKYNRMEVIGHYRFDASKIDENVLVKWK